MDTFHPDSKRGWNTYMLMVCVWTCTVSIFLVCFAIKEPPNTVIGAIELIANISYVIDILVTFRTAVYGGTGKLIYDRWVIAKRYLGGFFVVDLIAAIPFDYLIGHGGPHRDSSPFLSSNFMSTLGILRAFQVIKLLRLLCLPQFSGLFAVEFPIILLYWCPVYIIMVCHWLACAFNYVAYLDIETNQTWLHASKWTETETPNKFFGLLFGTSSMKPTPRRILVPVTTKEKWIRSFCILAGVVMYCCPVVIGFLRWKPHFLSMWPIAKNKKLEAFVRDRKIPPALSRRMMKCVDGICDEEEEFISKLPMGLRLEAALFFCKDTISKVTFCHGKSVQFLMDVAPKFRFDFCFPGDYAAYQGDYHLEMHFVATGTLKLQRSESECVYDGMDSCVYVGELNAGDEFGERECLRRDIRKESLIAVKECELYTLSREALLFAVERFPFYFSERTRRTCREVNAAMQYTERKQIERILKIRFPDLTDDIETGRRGRANRRPRP